MDNGELLVRAFTEALNIDSEKVVDTLAYRGIPEWDSIRHMILIVNLENIFDISIDTDDVIDMSSVAKAKEILSKYNIEF